MARRIPLTVPAAVPAKASQARAVAPGVIDVQLRVDGPWWPLTNDEARHLRRELGRAIATIDKGA